MWHNPPLDWPLDSRLEQGTFEASVCLRFEAKDEDVRRSMMLLPGLLTKMGVRSVDIETSELILAEALNNIIEHAFEGAGQSCISLALTRQGETLVCVLRDQGKRMPGDRLPQGKPADTGADIDDLPEGGFGWMLIRRLTQNLVYRRVDGWNRLELIIPLGG